MPALFMKGRPLAANQGIGYPATCRIMIPPTSSQRSVLRLLCGISLLWATLAAAQDPYQAGDPGVDPPQRLEGEDPMYPEEARESGPEGRVILRVLVDAAGRVESVEPLRAPYGGELLRDAAIQAVEGWRYRAATLDGEPVACWVVASLEFYRTQTVPPPSRGGSSEAPELETETEPPPAMPPVPPPVPQDGGPVADPDPGAADPGSPTSGKPAPDPVPAAPPADPTTPPTAEPAGAVLAELEPEVLPPPPVPLTAIEPQRGGPGPLTLGATPDAAEALLKGAVRSEGPEGVWLRDSGKGLEVALGRDGSIRLIRYVFQDPTGTWEPSPWRTRSGLGARSSCVGIPPAQGRPDDRVEEKTAEGRAVSSLVYVRDGVRFTYRCAAGRLVELVVEEN
jgi:TonB family protein